MEKIEMLKRIIDDQAILINKLQGYLVGDIIQTPKKIKKTSRQIMNAEARVMVNKMLDRLQERNARKSKQLDSIKKNSTSLRGGESANMKKKIAMKLFNFIQI